MSYMNRDNILEEGILDTIVKKLFLNRSLKKNKKFKKEVNKLNTAISNFETLANQELKDLDPKAKPFKIKKYKI